MLYSTLQARVRGGGKAVGIVLGLGLAASAGSTARAELVYGISDDLDQLVSFDSSTPGTLKSAISLSGMANGEQIRSIDWVSGVLYGLGDQNHLYSINTTTGAVTPVGSQFSPILNGIDFGLSGGPSLLYVSSDLGQNLSLNPTTAAATVLPNYTGASLDSLAYDSITTGYLAVSAANDDLYSVNPTTGSTTLIGPQGLISSPGMG